MSSKAHAAATGSAAGPSVPEGEENIPQLGVLDEDDEFEEFETQDWSDADTALAHLSSKAVQISAGGSTNGGAGAAGGAPGAGVGLSMAGGSTSGGASSASGGGADGSAAGAGKGPADHLWQDNWDDDDVEDDFSKALRAELDKASVAAVTAQ